MPLISIQLIKCLFSFFSHLFDRGVPIIRRWQWRFHNERRNVQHRWCHLSDGGKYQLESGFGVGGGGGFCLEMELFLKLYSESCLFAEEITASSRRVEAETWKNKTLSPGSSGSRSCTFSAWTQTNGCRCVHWEARFRCRMGTPTGPIGLYQRIKWTQLAISRAGGFFCRGWGQPGRSWRDPGRSSRW